MSIEMKNIGMRLGACLLLSWGCFGVSAAAPSATPAVGLVSYSADGAKIFVARPAIAPDAAIDLQYPDARGKPACCIRLGAGALARPVADQGKVSDEDKGDNIFVYQVAAKDIGQASKAHIPFTGIAIIHDQGVQATATASRGLALGTAPTAIEAHTCLSAEGMHLFAEQQGRAWAHLYMGFDYQVKPTCDPKLFPAD